jgi:predicted transcriptional regulator
MSETNATRDDNSIELATELTIAWLSNPKTRASAEDALSFLKQMHDSMVVLQGVTTIGGGGPTPDETETAPEYTPAVSVRKSLASRDHIISLIDGKPYRTLKRHLSTNGLTPQEYRERYGLKADYPMVAPSYTEARRDMAKKIGLGRKPGQKVGAKATPKAKPRGVAAAKKAAQAHLGGNSVDG